MGEDVAVPLGGVPCYCSVKSGWGGFALWDNVDARTSDEEWGGEEQI